MLQREVDNLDGMLAELGQGITDQRHFDALEERAQGVASRIRGAFRKR